MKKKFWARGPHDLLPKQQVSLVVVIGSSALAFAQWHDPPQDGNGQPHDAGHNPGDQVVYHVGDHERHRARYIAASVPVIDTPTGDQADLSALEAGSD
jgi:hypothetical protein